MFRSLFLVVTACTLFSCSKPTGVKEATISADSVAINFFKGDGTIDSVFNVAILRNTTAIKELAGFIESSTTTNFKCGYDGSLHFFKKNIVIQRVNFRMNDKDCMHFSFLLNGKLYSTRLSGKAKQFLSAIKKPALTIK